MNVNKVLLIFMLCKITYHKIRHSEVQKYCLNIRNDSQQLIKVSFKVFYDKKNKIHNMCKY